MDIVINELSYEDINESLQEDQARKIMGTFVMLLVTCKQKFTNIAIRYDTELYNSLKFNEAYSLAKWMSDPQTDREIRQTLVSLLTRSPYLSEEEINDKDVYSLGCYIGDKEARGILAAYLLDGIAASIPLSTSWDNHEVSAILETINEDSDVLQSAIVIRHISEIKHLTSHELYFKNTIFTMLNTYQELWAQRQNFFSKLQFCESVEKDIASLEKKQFLQVRNKLYELNHYMENTYDGLFNGDSLPGKTTPDSIETLKRYSKERTFLCPDGIERIFSWHMRVTPGAVRIFFKIDCDIMYIGYVGNKLPTISDPK